MENQEKSIKNNSDSLKKNILIVDDSETMRAFIQSLLEKEYTIMTKSDGQEALDYLKQGHRPDLILSDMEMPNMNGRTFVRHVNSDPRLMRIPIVFITTVYSEMLINSFKDKVNNS